MNKVELTKSEVDGINLRFSCLQAKQLEAAIAKESLEYFFKQLLEKYKLEGAYTFNEGCLVKVEDPAPVEAKEMD